MRPGELTVSGKVATQLDWAIDELKVGDNAKALARLCRLRGQDVPDIQTRAVVLPVVGTIGEATPPPVDAEAERRRAERGAEPVTSFPKPRLRVVNPAAITAYKKKVQHCEVGGPDCHGVLDFTHIRSKNDEGDDCEENGLVQCRLHHGIFDTTKVGWWRAVGSARLNDAGKAKVLAVYPGLPDGDDTMAEAA